MDLEQHGGLQGDGLLVVPQVSLVGRAHLPQNGAALRHDLRQAKGAADLDQLAPGDDDLLAPGQGPQGQEYRGGVVVKHQGGLAPGELPEQAFQVVVAGPPGAPGQVVFQGAVMGPDLLDLGQGGGAQR
jgi:hypothetical protein